MGQTIQKCKTHEQCVAIVESGTGWDYSSTEYWVMKPVQILHRFSALIPNQSKNQKEILIEGRHENERLTIENSKRKQIDKIIRLAEESEGNQAGVESSDFILGAYYLNLMKHIAVERATFVKDVSERFIQDKEYLGAILKRFDLKNCVKVLDVAFDTKSKSAISWIDKDSLLRLWADEKHEMKFRLAIREEKKYRHEEQSAWAGERSTEMKSRRC